MSAREIADGVMDEHAPSDWRGWASKRVRDAIEAALLAAERRGVKVKPLEWVKPFGANTLTKATTILGIYCVWTHHKAEGKWCVDMRGLLFGQHLWSKTVASEADGHAAAQADCEARIRSALVPEGDGWLPISEAKRDGTKMIVTDGLGVYGGAWRLPEDFNPDGGIHFDRVYYGVGGKQFPHEPVGTNLFSYVQTVSMVRHMLAATRSAGIAAQGGTDV